MKSKHGIPITPATPRRSNRIMNQLSNTVLSKLRASSERLSKQRQQSSSQDKAASHGSVRPKRLESTPSSPKSSPAALQAADDQSKIIKEDQNEITWCIFSKHQLLCTCCNVPQLFLFHCFSYKELISKLCTVQNAPTLYLGLHPTSLSTLSIVHMLSHYILKGYHGW